MANNWNYGDAQDDEASSYQANVRPKQKRTARSKNQSKKIVGIALTLGIISIVTFIIPILAIALGIVAIIVGSVALKSSSRKEAIAAVITGALGIVIAIVILVIAINNSSDVNAMSRDTERKNDLKNISQQLETYYNDYGAYPVGEGVDAKEFLTYENGILGLTADDVAGPSSDAYLYTSDGQSCALTAQLEYKSDISAVDGKYTVECIGG